jgi:hypothetical protein
MEISEHELRQQMRSVDDLHRAGMATMPADIAELHLGEGARVMGEARRDGWSTATKTAVAIGGVAVPLALMMGRAYALDDGGIAAFAQSIELAAVEAYKAAAASGKVTTKAIADAATLFAGHHTEHAAAFGAAAGSGATNKPNPTLLKAVGDQLTSAANEMAIVTIAFGLENAAASTYLFALGALTSKAALQLTASILPVESQHAVVLGQVLGKTGKDLVPSCETTAAAVDPAKYPTS